MWALVGWPYLRVDPTTKTSWETQASLKVWERRRKLKFKVGWERMGEWRGRLWVNVFKKQCINFLKNQLNYCFKNGCFWLPSQAVKCRRRGLYLLYFSMLEVSMVSFSKTEWWQHPKDLKTPRWHVGWKRRIVHWGPMLVSGGFTDRWLSGVRARAWDSIQGSSERVCKLQMWASGVTVTSQCTVLASHLHLCFHRGWLWWSSQEHLDRPRGLSQGSHWVVTAERCWT